MIKYTRSIILCFVCFFLFLTFANSFENKILFKVNNQIITSLDILNELEYLQIINKEFPQAILSVDTFRSEIARRSIDNGADIINDISAGNLDPQMFDTVADLNVTYIMMHMQGTPQTMQDNPHYNCIEKEVVNYFLNKVKTLQQKGLSKIIIDPGFGFGKTLEHNYQLLNNLEELHTLELPILQPQPLLQNFLHKNVHLQYH